MSKNLVFILLLLLSLKIDCFAQFTSINDINSYYRYFDDNNHNNFNSDSTDQIKNLCAGYRIGIPFIVGIRCEYALRRNNDMMPIYLLTGDISLTLGYAVSLALERRIGHSPFYTGFGYNFTKVAIFASGGDVVVGGVNSIHSILVTIGLRTSYRKENSLNLSLGGLITPQLFPDYPFFPVFHISIVGISKKKFR
ncbi:MAG: hypothetical protein H8D45_04525 [Bacteroidetes bacterium]|nr:hypothetical protein [Bacteroidota bacterium]